jgi:hypothetical protein
MQHGIGGQKHHVRAILINRRISVSREILYEWKTVAIVHYMLYTLDQMLNEFAFIPENDGALVPTGTGEYKHAHFMRLHSWTCV